MSPLVLVGAGLVALAAGALILRSFGPAYRIGRLLSATPTVSVAQAVAFAASGEGRYVSVAGRIDSETEFEDEHHRPLVFRRIRLEARRDGVWQMLDDRRQAVPFEVREELTAIGIDHAALDTGLVVIPRGTAGRAGDASDLLPQPLPPDTPVRMRVDQVSSVEHAIVVGVPVLGPDGKAQLTKGPGRPLILTTLERDEAMRILAGGRRARPAAAAAALVGGLALTVVGLAWAVVEAVA